ncbi:MAG: UDP-3-O-(3-hydroxymyristoyl)glucosamine N-acyltransferase, partial [Burkholderiales bacterium]|nr:UDP-3-O-(3-hydroxymyristoyl)glucosamine N-acyltransferase [Burkholderiales bacterium]
GMSGITGHLEIADRVEISAHTLITKSIDKPGSYTGVYPFDTNREWRTNAAQLRHLGRLAARVSELEQMLKKQNGRKS